MDDYKAANTDRNVTYEKIESGMDLSTVGNRVAAYVQTNPNTTAYFDVGFWEAGAAQGIRNLGYAPGQMLLAGFDLVYVVFEEMEKGYVQLTVDQQPYYQGYMAVHQLYLMNKYGLSALDIDTGKDMIGPEDVAQIRYFKGMSVR